MDAAAQQESAPSPGGTDLSQGTRRAALGFIFAAALMDILAIGLIIPVLPDLVRRFQHGDAAAAAHYVGLFGLIFGLMQFVFSPIMGALPRLTD
jgi:DHA1 family tetracycline resistance protein-like MFS transporter